LKPRIDHWPFFATWLGLGELHLRRAAWETLEEVAQQLGQLREGEVESALLRGRAHLARREFAAARQTLEEAITRWPGTVGPRIILSHVLLQEGQDLVAAEQALRDVLALDPHQSEAQHNLGLLLQRQERRAG
jgi:Tfp pilus assembly protein PilF